jgi:hypothetical protein
LRRCWSPWVERPDARLPRQSDGRRRRPPYIKRLWAAQPLEPLPRRASRYVVGGVDGKPGPFLGRLPSVFFRCFGIFLADAVRLVIQLENFYGQQRATP